MNDAIYIYTFFRVRMWCRRVTVRLSDGAPDSDHSLGMVISGRQAGEGGREGELGE